MEFILNEHETVFNLVPVGVNYTCELCGKGIMEVSADATAVIDVVNGKTSVGMFAHRCSNCGGTMQLPKVYPFVAYLSTDEYEKLCESIKEGDTQ